MKALQILAGAILLGAAGGGVMLARHVSRDDAPRPPRRQPPDRFPADDRGPFTLPDASALRRPPYSGPEGAIEARRLRVGRKRGTERPHRHHGGSGAQVVSIFRDGYEIGTAAIIYGADNMPTPLGVFPILQKDATHVSNLYDAPMPYMLRLTNDGVAIHASDVRYGNATHGCIGVPTASPKSSSPRRNWATG